MAITTEDHRRQLTIDDAVNSVLLLKQVLHGKPDKLNSVYETIFAFNRGEIDSSAMVSAVSHLLWGHSNLVRSINTFLPETHKVQDYSLINRQLQFVNAINRRFPKDPEICLSFVKIMESHAAAAAHQKVSDLFRDFPELIRDFEIFLPETNRDGSEKCGPSYKRRTILSQSSGRSELDSEVLNDDWVCDAPKAISSERPAMDELQEAVLECEDKRYEMDMLIERGRSAKKRIKRKEELTVIDLRYIEKLYGELGLNVVEIVKKDKEILPIVRERIKQKVAELRRRRIEMNQRWAKVYQGDAQAMQMQCDD